MGLASTSKGFAYAVLEGPDRLVAWKLLRLPSRRVPKALSAALKRMQPLFVAFNMGAASAKRTRGRFFRHYARAACAADGTLLIPVKGLRSRAVRRSSKWHVAQELAVDFKELSLRVPKPRRAWESEDDRIGIFMALAAAVAAWRSFKGA